MSEIMWGYVAGRWLDMQGRPLVGKGINFKLATSRAVFEGAAIADADGVTLTIGADGQLEGAGVERVGEWAVFPLPVSDGYKLQPLDVQIRVTELMPGGAEYFVRVGSHHTKTDPLIVSSDVGALLEEPGALIKPVWWQKGTAIPPGAIPGRDLLYDENTAQLYAIVND
ncbi:hypothetical protein GALAXY_20 [Arthrobacter phage Galaxy]|uniref:Uncharacterized protein n=1 Tax=Arthrobacter phage Galaxy TaxID=1772326 RepID=A0A0U4JXK3_9CAUD|nr:tail protein [Arthrobacter phage Galaxy]ALY08866.1 hypothetical protein GALAXY_20 [Arthrobacter phage Galaxy]